jgi:hypothetical protein
VLNIGRQFGKTLLAENQLFKWAINNKNVRCAWISPIYKQSKKVYDEMVNAFSSSKFFHTNASDLIIKFPNKSTIQFFSAERYDNIRGFTFDYLVIDEFAFIDEQAWTEVLRATVLVKGKKVLLISTPKGKNHFYRMYGLQEGNEQYKSFTMTSYDNPLINPTEIDDARLTLPEHIFRQEYLAEFVDKGSELFADFKVNNTPEKTKRCYAGIDVGRADDYTVLTIINELGEMIYVDRWRQDSWAMIVDKVVNKLNEYGCYTLVESNSIGDAIFEQIRNKVKDYGKIESFVTTNKSKQDIIEGLIVANQHKEVSMLPCEWLKKELDMFTYEYSPKTKTVRYAAPNGFHDDGVMSLAIAYHSLKSQATKGVYAIR